MSKTSPAAAIALENVSLRYFLATQKVGSIKEYFIHLVRGALSYEEFWALRDIDLRIEPGEAVGLVGPNGAGKSTLAKVVAGVLRPTRGQRRVEGVIAPLLELGTGFDVELTGYENIFLNALFLGRRRREIQEKVDDIMTFSGLGKFIHTPIRSYSSGMVARLGFSIATAWVPDVLILDEVLTVGDVRFLDRCHARIDSFRRAGTTLLLISHAPQVVLEYCSRCVWLDQGRLCEDGPATEVLGRYEAAMHAAPAAIEQAAPEAPVDVHVLP